MNDETHALPLESPRSQGAPLVQVFDYHKSYRDTLAVTGLTFEVLAGSVMGLVGPNGAGKSTTLRALAGIIPPTRGALRIAGHDVVADPIAAKQQLAFVPDDPKLFDTLTVREHFEFVASAYAVANYEPLAAELLDHLELTDKRDTIAQELSRGMRQKVAIGCAYLHAPRVILFDEPLTGLDPRGIRRLKESIKERARGGAAILVSSHLLALVEDLCDHLLIMQRGKALFCGAVAEARTAFAQAGQDASLEEIFFRATDGDASSPSPRE